jgi:hypothetical protein
MITSIWVIEMAIWVIRRTLIGNTIADSTNISGTIRD